MIKYINKDAILLKIKNGEITDILYYIKLMYDEHTVNKDDVLKFVEDNLITPADYQTIVLDECPLGIEVFRNRKINQVGNICRNTIYNGVDVQLSDGQTYHFSLNSDDQANIDAIYTKAVVSDPSAMFPYHADDNFCKLYSAQDVISIGSAAMQHSVYHRTLCNYINMYIKSLTSIEDINLVTYSVDTLSTEYKDRFTSFISSVPAL